MVQFVVVAEVLEEVKLLVCVSYRNCCLKMSSGSVGAYGARWATGQCDPLAYFRKPEVMLRLLAWVSRFSVCVLLWAWSFCAVFGI